jgi:protein gp37
VGKDSKIEWCDHTFNPWWGCQEVSSGCDHCYAKTFANRLGYSECGTKFPIWGTGTTRRFFGDAAWAEPVKWNKAARLEGQRRLVFCASMAENTPHLDWLLLTKRPMNFRRFLPKRWLESPRKNVMGMTTVESMTSIWRAAELINTPFAFRGLAPWLLRGERSGLPPRGQGEGGASTRRPRVEPDAMWNW